MLAVNTWGNTMYAEAIINPVSGDRTRPASVVFGRIRVRDGSKMADNINVE